MLRLNILLLVVLVTVAMGVVSVQHKSRRVHAELERQQDKERALEVEYSRLQLEQSTLGAHARVDELARQKLAMQAPSENFVITVDQGRQP